MLHGVDRLIESILDIELAIPHGSILDGEIKLSPQELELYQLQVKCTEINGYLTKLNQKKINPNWMKWLSGEFCKLVTDANTFDPRNVPGYEQEETRAKIERVQCRVITTIVLFVKALRVAGVPLSILGSQQEFIYSLYQQAGGDTRAILTENAAILQNLYDVPPMVKRYLQGQGSRAYVDKAINTFQRKLKIYIETVHFLCQDELPPEVQQAVIRTVDRCLTVQATWHRQLESYADGDNNDLSVSK